RAADQEVPAADARQRALAARAVNRHVLAYQVVVADFETARLALELHVLRLAAQGCVLVDAIAATERGEALDDRVRADFAALLDTDLVLDDGVRADPNAARDRCLRADDCCRVCFHNLADEAGWYDGRRQK